MRPCKTKLINRVIRLTTTTRASWGFNLLTHTATNILSLNSIDIHRLLDEAVEQQTAR